MGKSSPLRPTDRRPLPERPQLHALFGFFAIALGADLGVRMAADAVADALPEGSLRLIVYVMLFAWCFVFTANHAPTIGSDTIRHLISILADPA